MFYHSPQISSCFRDLSFPFASTKLSHNSLDFHMLSTSDWVEHAHDYSENGVYATCNSFRRF